MNEFTIALSDRGDVLVVALGGEIDFTNAAEIEQRIFDAGSNDHIAIVVDLSDTTYVDSAGVRLLFDLARRVEGARQRLGIVVPPEAPLQRLVTVTNLASVATIRATADECVQALRDDVAGATGLS